MTPKGLATKAAGAAVPGAGGGAPALRAELRSAKSDPFLVHVWTPLLTVSHRNFVSACSCLRPGANRGNRNGLLELSIARQKRWKVNQR